MSPAAVPTLPMPTAETKDAGAFIASDWHALKGTDQKDLSFVKNPLDSAGDIVLQMEYPKGSYSGSDSGGVGGLQLAVYGEGQNRAILSYEVRNLDSPSLSHGESQLIRVRQVGFNKGFDFVKGGKLPGLYGGDTNAHCTGGQNSETCFSLRREHHRLRLTGAVTITLMTLFPHAVMWRQDGQGEGSSLRNKLRACLFSTDAEVVSSV
jgi:hypothetical protein